MSNSRLVFSTEIGRIKPQEELKPVVKTDGIIRIRRETKGRNGKGVTTISGFSLKDIELKELCTKLKKQCGTGGSVKEGVIEIQGDNRDKIKATLEQLGHTVKLAGG
ncbi:stress response translation initiation inhibitor YciH [Paraglaciecola hydrolytica]|uniref:Translation initiation factor Sui1 n=1 Tax=Paraglaciecola hydrolytica TaxID=1799789 RepID=A0A136A5U6_9ALTE|nr:stress response translation initiation inhibitor YciH [Paraglaciecola hydrolytica]KXI30615.1 translation initiation factor Sui1 [Paraglaciecola hydrolytica]